MKLVVLCICLNEAKTLDEVLNRIPKKIDGISEIVKVVVDDGSTDDTAKIARKNGAKVLMNMKQKGLPYSFQRAIEYAIELGADIAVNIDGDMQLDPAEIPNVVEPVVSGKADFVAADRFTDPKSGRIRRPENMPFMKYYGNLLGAKVISNLTKQNFVDVTCGFRAYNRKAMLNVNINNKDTYTQESFQVLATKKLNIEQVPVSVKYFKTRKSRIVKSIFKYTSRSALNITRSFRDYAPLRFFVNLGSWPMVLGILGMGFTGIHWLKFGTFTPYKFVGLLGIYLTTLGIIIWLVGLLADILDRVINNQEKILYYQKLARVPKDNKKK